VRDVSVDGASLLYVWVEPTDDATVATLRADDDVESVERLDSVGGDALVRVERSTHRDGPLQVLDDCDGSLLEAVGEAGTWTFQFRFPARDDVAAFYRGCLEQDVPVDLRTILISSPFEAVGPGLDITARQRATLVTALEEGYFSVPREINLAELADRLGISDTATSQRLRRGTATLLEATLAGSPPAHDDSVTDSGSG
jgi:hypothetical protein